MLQFAKAIGKNTDLLTAQSFAFSKIESDQFGESKVFLFVLISGVGDDVFTTVRQCGPLIEESFFAENISIQERFSKLDKGLKTHLDTINSLQIGLVAIKKETLYLQQSGYHQVFLNRQGKLSDLTENVLENQMISGHLQTDDKVLIVSCPAIDLSDIESLPKWNDKNINSLISSDVESFEDDFEDFLRREISNEPLATILVSDHPERLDLIQNKRPVNTKTRKFTLPRLDFTFAKNILNIITIIKWRQFWNLKIGIFVIVMMFVILSIGFFWLRDYQQDQELGERTIGLFTEAKRSFTDAKNKQESDHEGAITALTKAERLTNQVLKINPGNNEAKTLKKQIEESKVNILKVYEISDFSTFLSLDLIKPGFNATLMSFSVGQLLLLDKDQKTVVLLDIKSKNPKILGGSVQFGNAKFASLNGEDAFVYSVDKGITEVNTVTNKISNVIKPDNNWGFISSLVAFAQNLYLVDSAKNQIYKYTPVQSGFSEKIDYLESNETSLSDTNKMEIDYSVWILRKNSELLRFTGGVNDSFSIGGMEKPLQTISSIFVSEDDSKKDHPGFVYILDSENERLVVLTKNGTYYSQYVGDKFKKATDLVVDKENKKIYLLEGGKIYQIDLKE